MPRLIVPLKATSIVDDGSFAEALRRLHALRADAVLSYIPIDGFTSGWETVDEGCRAVCRRRDDLRSAGIDPFAVWITALYGISDRDKKSFGTLTVRRDGQKDPTVAASVCPLDTEVGSRFGQLILRIARKTGIKRILLDDDFRIQFISTDARCFCEKHMALYRRALGEDLSREELCARIFTDDPHNRYRTVWQKVNEEALLDLCRRIRREVDEGDPSVNVAVCAGPSAMWGAGGRPLALEMSRILAGKNPPFLRLIGGPYWSPLSPNCFDMNLPEIIDLIRREAAEAAGQGIELFAESDVFPRSRFHVPASHATAYDLAMAADGHFDRIQKYVCIYDRPFEERGYWDEGTANADLLEAVGRLSPGRAVGFHPFKPWDEICHIPLGGAPAKLDVEKKLITSAETVFLNRTSFPTSFEKDAPVVSFGHTAWSLSVEDLRHGALLDIPAAAVLTARGLDVGLADTAWETVPADAEILSDAGRIPLSQGEAACRFRLSENAVLFSRLLRGENSDSGAYFYRNADGILFCVLPYDMRLSPVFSSTYADYRRQEQTVECYRLLTGHDPAASCPGYPYLYPMVKETAYGLFVGLWNFSLDPIRDLTVSLSARYDSAEFLAAEGRLDGRVCHVDLLPARQFCAVVLKK